MKVATFNAASIRARMPIVVEWLAEHEPDVLAVQETKVEEDKFPLAEFEDLGYHVAIHGQKSWNGVATITRSPMLNVRCGFHDELFPNDCRVLAGEVDGVSIVNTYVPNGSAVGSDKFEYKLRWLERFRRYLFEHYRPDQELIWLGDINIAPTPNDVYNSPRFLGGVGHHPEEFARLDAILEFGLEDLFRKFHPGPGHYTFWDFVVPKAVEMNRGWRIDHIYATPPLADRCEGCWIDVAPRKLEKPSDHTFVVAEFRAG
jgi:exodeoxyribonuclease III